MSDLTFPPPTLVKVIRVKRPNDLDPVENFVGYLVDSEGNDIETPVIGEPICLAGDEKSLPWLFRSDPVYQINIFDGHWVVMTEQGYHYVVENERIYN